MVSRTRDGLRNHHECREGSACCPPAAGVLQAMLASRRKITAAGATDVGISRVLHARTRGALDVVCTDINTLQSARTKRPATPGSRPWRRPDSGKGIGVGRRSYRLTILKQTLLSLHARSVPSIIRAGFFWPLPFGFHGRMPKPCFSLKNPSHSPREINGCDPGQYWDRKLYSHVIKLKYFYY